MLIVGLGNPGSKYEKTKHNFGFWVLDLVVKRCSLKWEVGYGDYVYVKHNQNVYAKPTSFMNNSGLAIKDLCKHHNQSSILVVYDDIDLHFGTIRYKYGGGTGGHKGIESIIYHLHTEEFNRLKLGIALNDINMKPSEKYVLAPFPKKYSDDLNDIIVKSADSIDFFLNHTIEQTMNKYNRIIKGDENNDDK